MMYCLIYLYVLNLYKIPVVMYGCKSWTVKKAEHRRIDAFELWCWRRLLRVPWTARRSNQSILKVINPEYSLEGLMLKFPYFGHLMWRANSLEKTLILRKIEGRRRRGRQRTRWLDGHESEQTLGDGDGQESLAAPVHGVTKSRTWLTSWTNTIHKNNSKRIKNLKARPDSIKFLEENIEQHSLT